MPTCAMHSPEIEIIHEQFCNQQYVINRCHKKSAPNWGAPLKSNFIKTSLLEFRTSKIIFLVHYFANDTIVNNGEFPGTLSAGHCLSTRHRYIVADTKFHP